MMDRAGNTRRAGQSLAGRTLAGPRPEPRSRAAAERVPGRVRGGRGRPFRRVRGAALPPPRRLCGGVRPRGRRARPGRARTAHQLRRALRRRPPARSAAGRGRAAAHADLRAPGGAAGHRPAAFGLPLSLYEFPFETVRLVAQLLYNGTLERFPELRIILPHGGGGVTYYADRLTYGPVSTATSPNACRTIPSPCSAASTSTWRCAAGTRSPRCGCSPILNGSWSAPTTRSCRSPSAPRSAREWRARRTSNPGWWAAEPVQRGEAARPLPLDRRVTTCSTTRLSRRT